MLRSVVAEFLLLTMPVFAQGIITNYAGSYAVFFDTGHPPTEASVIYPSGAAVDAQGNLFITSGGLNTILRVTPAGVITVYAGNGLRRAGGDGGPAISASLNNPLGLALDTAGNLYIADSGNQRVRRVSREGLITTVAGTGAFGFSGDGGRATLAQFFSPAGVAVDPAGNLYISDRLNQRIRKVDPAGIVTTVAGTGANGATGDGGPALQATFSNPNGLAFDAAGNLYIADVANALVRRLAPNGIVTTVAGTGPTNAGFGGDGGPGVRARLNQPTGVAVDAAGNLYIADSRNQRIRQVNPAGVITTVAGNGTAGFAGDTGPATAAAFNHPYAVAAGLNGAIYVADRNNGRLRQFQAGGAIATIAGSGVSIGDNGPATAAILNNPQSLAIDLAGNLYIADTGQNRVRKVTPGGIVSSVAGNGLDNFAGNGGPATEAALAQPGGVAVDPTGNLYIADSNNNVVRKVNPQGVISAFAGNGGCCQIVDGGPAINTPVFNPQRVALDSAGNVYFLNRVRSPTGVTLGQVVRRVGADGIVRTVAGSQTAGFGGDGGPATSASLGVGIINIAFDQDDNLLIADAENHRVRRVDRAGIIRTIAGNGSSTASGNGGPATSAGLPTPMAVVSDAAGNLYISSDVRTIRKVTPDGRISAYAGLGIFGSFGDGGPALRAALATPIGLAIDSAGNLYSVDLGNDRVRQIRPDAGPLVALSQDGLTFEAVAGAAPSATQSIKVINSGAGSMNWAANAILAAGTPPWLSVTPATGVSEAGAGGTLSVGVDPSGMTAGTHYGQVQITAPGSPNSPLSLTVVLSVLPAGQSAGVTIQPSGVLLAAEPQSIVLTASGAETYTATLDFGGEPAWFSATPAAGTIGAGQSLSMVVQPAAQLAPGVYRGSVRLTFSDSSATVPVLLAMGGESPAATRSASLRSAVCTPKQLVPVITSLAGGVNVAVGWPTPIEAQVVDDCGQPMTGGTVVATFSTGDAPVPLRSLQNGTWAGTWSARNTGAASLTVTATSREGQHTGRALVAIGLRANVDLPPSVQRGGVLNGASLTSGGQLAPGTIVTILGSQLASSSVEAREAPLPTVLGGTSVIAGGERLALLSVQPDRISAILPLDLAIDTTHQLVVSSGSNISLPAPVSLLSSSPGIFTLDGSGQGSAVISVLAADNSQTLVGPARPAAAGETIVINCAGMGNVNPLAVAGSPAPNSPLSIVVDNPTVTIGGIAAQVRFALLAPGRLGVYQIGVVVPEGVAPGDDVPVVVSQPGGTAQSAISLR